MSIENNITADDHFFAGEDKQLVFDIVTSTGATQTMTGWALECVFRRSAAASAVAFTTATTALGTITIGNGSGTDDRATVTLTDDLTVGLVTGTYFYTLRRTDAGSEQVLAYGTMELLKAATR